MKISDLDANFKHNPVNLPDVVWRCAREEPFKLSGLRYAKDEECFCRMPNEIAREVSTGVFHLSYNTSGGQLRFSTDADYIALKVAAPTGYMMRHMPIYGTFGFSLYEDGAYIGTFAPTVEDLSPVAPFAFEGVLNTRTLHVRANERCMREYTIYFPLYSGVREVFVGLPAAAALAAPAARAHAGYLLAYGSSITQGGCASHPGNDYINMLSRMLDIDVYNLGFSGNARAEDVMIDYLCSLSPSVFLLDYDHIAPTVEHLEATHEKLFRAFRAAHPETPVIMMSRPDFDYHTGTDKRRAIVRRTYENARAAGDTRVYFIDGEALLGKDMRDACAVDCCHPNDLGFYRMAQTVYPVVKLCLDEAAEA